MRMPAHVNKDKKKLYLVLMGALALLLAVWFLPENGRRIAAAVLLPVLAATVWYTVRKRGVLSHHKSSVLLIMAVMGVLYVTLYFLSGAKFGFMNVSYRTGPINWLRFILPVTAIIVSSEIVRYVARVQGSRVADAVSYVICVMGELFISTNVGTVDRFVGFMDFVGLALFPALTAHALYHYLAKRYGMLPNIVYRAIITLYAFIIPVAPMMPDSLFAFLSLFIPPLIHWFVDSMYEKRLRQAQKKKKSKYTLPLTVAAVACATAVILLIAGQLPHHMLVIATESMTGELNKGDAAFYQEYSGDPVEEGQIIVFEKDGSTIVHRVVDIQYINGETRYITKGDINEDTDAGYVLPSQIQGIFTFKIPYVGYTTLWLRGLFAG